MPDGYSGAIQVQRGSAKQVENVRDQAERLHGRRQPTAPKDVRKEAGRPARGSKSNAVVTAAPSKASETAKRHIAYGRHDSTSTSATTRVIEEAAQQHPKRNHNPAPHTSTSTSSTTTTPSTNLTFYPVYTHTASPTSFTWVKLTAYHIHHTLTHQPNYLHSWLTDRSSSNNIHARDAPQLLFYKNHPIQFVQVIGVVVSIEEYFEKFWLFTVDDSSGVTVDVVCRKPDKNTNNTNNKQVGHKLRAQGSGNKDEDKDENEEETEIIRLSSQVATEVHIGAVVQVKGVITLFHRRRQVQVAPAHSTSITGHPRSTRQEHPQPPPSQPTRQLTLQRLSIIPSTTKEIALIASRTHFYNAVLNKPWVLTPKEQAKLHRAALGELEHKRKKVRRQAENKRDVENEEARDAEDILRGWVEEEKMREEEAERARRGGVEVMEGVRLRKMVIESGPRQVPRAMKVHEPRVAEVQREDHAKKQKRKAREDDTKQAPKEVRVIEPHGLDMHGEEPVKKQKRKKRQSLAQAPDVTSHVSGIQDDTSLSFGADDGEKSALLRAAFG
ncbi:hypothetical protein PMZ80_001464 [Knufia obscura]|uniref:CST complex subunit Stn1 N-terminal domain-containing protein n=2 Tax=Knufia TaxID=430999 RepID=A0AAN8I7D0_9EURO|nr:hypothetical protein PMZ80_001464 [Knufia obscura]KAK5955714.1 hypothetical protein OHC33_003355 [Knufia fluminis]